MSAPSSLNPPLQGSRHIAILSSHFQPETNAGANRVTALAEYLASAGWQVTVVTQLPHHPQNAIYSGWETTKMTTVSRRGRLTVMRLKPWLVPKDKLHWRLLSELHFCIRALPLLLRLKSDIYFSSSPYMFTGPTAAIAARLRHKAFAWDIRDLTWLYPKAAGKRTFGVDRILAGWMRWTARQARVFSATTQGQLDYFNELPGVKLLLPNGVTKDIYDELGLLPRPLSAERPKVLYAGLFGFNHKLEVVLEAAELVPEADFLLIGDGPEREALQATARNMENVAFLPFQPLSRLLELYGTADVLVHHFRKNPIFRAVQSAKVLEYMATGRPLVYASEGEAITLLNEYSIGLAAEPENPRMLAEAIRSLIQNREQARAMGQRARSFIGEHRIREKLYEDYESVLLRYVSP